MPTVIPAATNAASHAPISVIPSASPGVTNSLARRRCRYSARRRLASAMLRGQSVTAIQVAALSRPPTRKSVTHRAILTRRSTRKRKPAAPRIEPMPVGPGPRDLVIGVLGVTREADHRRGAVAFRNHARTPGQSPAQVRWSGKVLRRHPEAPGRPRRRSVLGKEHRSEGGLCHSLAVIDDSPEVREDLPPLRPTQARGLIMGLTLFWLGVAIEAWTLGTKIGLLIGSAIAAIGAVAMLLAGGRKFVPRTPRRMLATARVARLPPWPATVLAFTVLGLAIIGLFRFLVLPDLFHP